MKKGWNNATTPSNSLLFDPFDNKVTEIFLSISSLALKGQACKEDITYGIKSHLDPYYYIRRVYISVSRLFISI